MIFGLSAVCPLFSPVLNHTANPFSDVYIIRPCLGYQDLASSYLYLGPYSPTT